MNSSLNHIFRTIWSDALGTWVAVSELTMAKGKRSGSSVLDAVRVADANSQCKQNSKHRFKPIIFALACCYGLNAQANPIGAQVASGSASFNQSGNVLTVTNTPNAIINWQGFSIGSGESTNFVQQSASSSVLNRVVGPDPSILLGALTSNGRVFLINSAGIMVGQGARIDVAGLVASTLNLSDADFLAGKLNFGAVANAGAVQNYGNITTPEGGTVYLVAPQVENHGLITTPKGETILAAGNSVQLIDTGTPGVSVQITGAANSATNLGQILADSGRIGMVGAVVKNSGTINANSLVSQGGKIFLKATSSIATDVNSVISADGSKGGEIILKTEANGQIAGDLVARGSLSAQGNGAQGSGGFIETSAARVNIADVNIATRGGQWLIDPYDLTVVASGGTLDPLSPSFVANANSSTITNTTIQTALAAGNSVVLDTGVVGTQTGNITVNAPIIAAVTGAGTTLTLNAAGNIIINQPIVSTSAALNLILNHGSAGNATLANTLYLAGGNVDVRKANVTGTGTFNVTAGSTSLSGALTAAALNLSGTGVLNLDSTIAISNASIATGSTLNLNGATASSITSFSASGGTLGGSGAVSIGTFNLNGLYSSVTLTGAGAKSVGTLNFQPGPNDYQYLYLDGTTLNTQTAVSQTKQGASTILVYLQNGATLNNTGIWTLDAFSILNNGGLPWQANTFNNTGTTGVVNVTGAGATIGAVFNNSSTAANSLNVGAGTLTLSGSGTLAATSNIANGAGLVFNGTYDLTGATAITGAGNVTFAGGTQTIAGTVAGSSLTMNGGTATLNGVMTMPALIMSGGTLNLNTTGASSVTSLALTGNYGTLNTAGALSVGALSMTGYSNTLGGAGSITVTGATTFAPTSNYVDYLYVNGTTLNTQGAVTHTRNGASTVNVYVQNGGTINNSGTWTLDALNVYSNGGAVANTFNNTGMGVVNVPGAGATINTVFNNSSTAANSLNVAAGILTLSGSGTLAATSNIASGAGLVFNGTYDLTGVSAITGAGNVTFAGGTQTIAGTVAGSSLTMNGGTATLNGVMTMPALTLSGGTLNLNTTGASSVNSLALTGNYGTLNTAGALSAGTLTMTGYSNTLGGAGSITVAGATTFAPTSNYVDYLYVNGTTLNTQGAVTHTRNGASTVYVYVQNGGTINNSGTWTLDALNVYTSGSGINTFNNNGTGAVNVAAGGATISTVFNNSSTAANSLNVGAGTLTLSGSGTLAASSNIASGAGLVFNGTYDLTGASAITGAGNVTFAGGTQTIAGTVAGSSLTMNGGTATLNGVMTMPALTLSGGTLNLNTTGASSVTSLALTGNYGTLNTAGALSVGALSMTGYSNTLGGAGSITVTGAMTFAPTSNYVDYLYVNGTTLNTQGAVTHTPNGTSNVNVYVQNGGTINNSGTWTLDALNVYTSGSGINTFNNNGTGAVNVAAGGATISTVFNNSSVAANSLNVAAGTLTLSGSGTLAATTNIVAGAGLIFNGTYDLTGATAITGAGNVTFAGGTQTIAGTVAGSSLTMNGGTATLNGVMTVPALTLSGGTLNLNTTGASSVTSLALTGNYGTLNTAGALSVGALSMTGYSNTLGGAGSVTVTGAMTFAPTLNYVDYLYVNGTTLNTQGAVTHTRNGTSTVNVYVQNGGTINNSGTWTLDALNVYASGTGTNTFNNSGTGVVNVAAGGGTINSVFNNSSTAANSLNVGAGTLTLSGSGTLAATSNIASGAGLTFSGTYDFGRAGAITGAGTLTLAGATILGTLSTTGTVLVPSGNFTLGTGAIWNNSGTVTITSGGWGYIGTNAILNNSGSIDIGNNFGTNFNGASGGQFNNNVGGTVTLSGFYSAPITGAGGTFSNAGTLTKTTTTTQTITNLSNTGIVNINAGTSFAVSGVTSNSGTVNVNAGSLTFSGATTLSGGSINLASGTSLTLAGATVLSGGSLIGATGVAPVVTASGAWTLNNTAALVFDNVIINHNSATIQGVLLGANSPVTMQNGAVINNTGAWTMNNATFTQGVGATSSFNNGTGGSINVPAGGSLVFANVTNAYTAPVYLNNAVGATIDLSNGVTYSLGNLTNDGTIQVTAGTGTITGDVINNSLINITGTLNFNRTLSNTSTGTINLNGTLTSTLGTTNAGIVNVTGASSVINGLFNNNGTLNVNNSGAVALIVGGLTLTGGGSGNGVINLNGAGSGITFSNGTFNQTGATAITNAGGNGYVTVSSGTTTLSGTVAVPTLTMNGGTLNLNNAAGTSVTTLAMNNGTLNSVGAFSAGTMTMAGNGTSTLTGAGGYTVTGALTFLPTANAYPYLYVDGTVLNTQGAVSQTVNGTSKVRVQLSNGATINNTSTWTMNSFDITSTGTGVNTFNNSGVGRLDVLGSGASIASVFNNSAAGTGGGVNVSAGTFTLSGGGSSTFNSLAPLTFAAGTTVNFAGGSNTITGLIRGSGALTFSGGTNVITPASGSVLSPTALTVSGGVSTVTMPVATNWTPTTVSVSNGSLDIGATTLSTSSWTQSGGTFGSSGGVTVALGGALTWTGGTINGLLTTLGNTTVSSGNFTLGTGAVWNNSGTVTITSGGWGYIGTNATWNNTGTVDIGNNFGVNFNGTSGAQFNNQLGGVVTLSGVYSAPITGTGGVFNNAGTLNKTTSTAQTISSAMTNTGVMNINASTLALNGSSSSGTITVATGAGLVFSGGTNTITSTGSVSGAGTLLVSGGTLNYDSAYSLTGGVTVSGGTANFNMIVSTPSLSFTGGTLNAVGGINTNSLNWSGGTLLGSLTLNSGGVGTLSSYYKYLGDGTSGGTFTNLGTITDNTVNGYYSMYLNANSTFNNQGSYTLTTDGNFYTNAATSLFSNSGVFTKSGGTGISSIQPTFSNTGTVNVNSGTLQLNNSYGGSSTDSGAFNVASGSTLQFNGGTHTITSTGSVSGAGALTMGAGTLNFNGSYAIGGTLNLTGGTLNLGTTTAIPTLNFSGGTLSGVSGANTNNLTWSGGTLLGSLTLNSGGTGTLSSYYKYLGDGTTGGTFTNLGTITDNTVNGYYSMYLQANSLFNNQGSYTLTTDGNFYTNAATSSFSNSGTFTKSGGTGISYIQPTFTNTGTLNVNSGTLQLSNSYGGSSTDSGAFNVASGSTLQFNGGTHTITSTGSVSGAGTLTMSAGTLNFNGSYAIGGTLNLTGGTLNLGTTTAIPTLNFSGGTLNGASGANTNNLTWSGGTLLGNLTLNSGGTGTLSSYYKYLGDGTTGGTFTSLGTITDNTVNGYYSMYLYANSTFNNQGIYTLATDAYFIAASATAAINNSGTLTKSGGTGISYIQPMFSNTGTVNVNSGTLQLNNSYGGSSTDTGAFSVASGSTLQFSGGTHNLLGALSGAGNFMFSAGTETISGAVSGIGLTVAGATLNLKNAAGSSLSTLAMNSGTLYTADAVSIGNLTATGGTLAGPGSYTVTGATTFTACTNCADYLYLNGSTFNTQGAVTHTRNGNSQVYIYVQNGGTINNTGTWTLDGVSIYNNGGVSGYPNTFNNAANGTVNVAAGGGTISTDFNSSGNLNLNGNSMTISGQVTLNGGVLNGGTITAGTLTLNNALAINGSSSLTLDNIILNKSGATTQGLLWANSLVTMQNGAVINNSGAWTMNNVTVNQGTGAVSSFNNNLGGSVIVPAGGSASFNGVNFVNTGTLTASGSLVTGLLVNALGATLDITGQTVTKHVTNNGTMQIINGGSATITGNVINNNLFNITGTANINGTLTNNATGTITLSSGTLNVLGGTTDNGTLSLAAATTNIINGTYTKSTALNLASGTLNLNGTTSLTTLNITGGMLGGTGSLTLVSGGTATQTEGTLAINTFNVANGAIYNISNTTAPTASTPFFNPTTFNNSGVVNWDGTAQQRTPGGTTTFNNLSGGQFNILNNVVWDTCCSGGLITFNNQVGATITKSSSGASGFAQNIAFNNYGTLNVNAGTLDIAGTAGFTQTGTINVASTATFKRAAGFTNSGTLSGSGTIAVGAGAAALINKGTINPGGTGAAGTLAISGDLQLATGSNLNMEMGGATAGLFDILAVTGNVTLAGALNASLLTGYTPVNGDALSFITMTTTAQANGIFAVASLPAGFSAGYNLAAGEAARLIYSSVTGAVVFTNAIGGLDWATAGNWSSGAVPIYLDSVLLSTGLAVKHATGTDTIAALTINNGNFLDVSGGSLTVSGNTTLAGGLTVSGTGSAALNGGVNGATSGQLSVSGGSLNLGAAASLYSLTLTGGALNGTGSLAVTNSYSQTAGTLGSSTGATFTGINITQASGNLALGGMAASGAISVAANNGGLSFNGAVSANTISATATGITLGANVVLKTTGIGDAIVLDAGSGNFSNNAGVNALSVFPQYGRWLIYSSDPALNNFGGLASGNLALWGRTSAGGAVTEVGNRYLFSKTPMLTVSAGAITKTYGDDLTVNSPVASITGLVDAAAYGNVFTQDATSGVVGALLSNGFAANAKVNLSPYAITFATGTLAVPAGYGVTAYVNGTLTVDPLALAGTIARGNTTYGSALVPGIVTFTNALAGDVLGTATVVVNTTSANTSSSGNLKAGNYTGIQSVSALSGADAGNYTFTNVVGDYTVSPLALTGTIAAANTTYGSALTPGLANLTNKVGIDVLNPTTAVNTTGLLSSSGNLKAGSYTGIQLVSSLTGADAGNYTFANVLGDYTVNPLALTGTITAANSTYGSSLTPGFANFSNKLGNDVLTAVIAVNTTGLLSSSGNLIAGTHTGKQYVSALNGADAGNYTFANVVGDYTVNKLALLNAAIASASTTYGSTLAPGTLSFGNVQTGANSDVVTGSVSVDYLVSNLSTSGKLNAGSYTQTASTALAGADAGNYTFGGFTTAISNYTVNKLALTNAAIAAANTTYGSTLTPGALTFGNVQTGANSDVVNALVGIDYTTANLSTSGKLNAGSYTQTAATTLTGADAGNYTFAGFTTAISNYTVNKLALTNAAIAAANTTYGSTLAPGALTFGNVQTGANSDVVTALVGVDYMTSNLSTGGKLNVGSYTQTAATTLTGADAGNYTFAGFTTATNNYTVNKLALTGSIAAGSSIYGATLSPGAVNFTNAAANDALGVATIMVNTAGNTSSSGHLKAGTYIGNQSVSALNGVDAGNYTFANIVGDYTVSTATITAVTGIAANNKVYDGTATAALNTVGVGYTGMVTGDALSVSATGAFVDKNVGSAKTVNISGITLGGADAANYTLSNSTATTTANIAILASVNWTGTGGNSLWSNAANWAGGALPDLANVAAVTIPAGQVVVYDGSVVGTTALQNLTINGSLTFTGGTLGVGGGAQYLAGVLSLGGGSLNIASGGSLDAVGFAQSGGTLSGSGNFTVSNSFAQTGGVMALNGSAIKIIQATGDINFTNTGVITINGLTASNGNIIVNNTGAITTTGPVSASGTVSITAHSPLTIGSGGISAVGNIFLVAGKTVGGLNDILTINGLVNSTAGGISFSAGNGIFENILATAPNGVSRQANLNNPPSSPANLLPQLTPTPPTSGAVAPDTVTGAIDVVLGTGGNLLNPIVPAGTTIGGTPGTFGGSDTANTPAGDGTANGDGSNNAAEDGKDHNKDKPHAKPEKC